jgi:hypothetical protein
MTIGFVVSFFDFRNDVRRVITEVSQSHNVVIFGKPEHRDEILRHLPQGIAFRLIDEKTTGFWNKLWVLLYVLLKQIPKSRENFFLMELFKASITVDSAARAKNYSIINWVRRLPKIISYDFYLDRLSYKSKTDLSGIDQFISFTAIADDFFHARLLRENLPVKVYVYSWDHPCKHVCFSKRAQYVCWNEALREDIIELQYIPKEQVTVVGASQFGYIVEYQKRRDAIARTYNFDYAYMGCAIGAFDLVADEVMVVQSVAEVLQQTNPTWKLVVRPYPVQANWALYKPLRKLQNVVMDDGFRTLDLSVKDGSILEKFEKIDNAKAFLHLGTTMGLEACFTDTPSFMLDYGYNEREGLSLYNFIHQFQNDRHLIDLAPQNAPKSEAELVAVFQNLNEPKYRELNHKVQAQYQLKSFSEFAKDLIGCF